MSRFNKWIEKNPMPSVTIGFCGGQNPYWVNWKTRFVLALTGEAFID